MAKTVRKHQIHFRTVNFSRRAEWTTPVNGLTLAKEARRERGLPLLDLTESNPTTVGLPYPADPLAAIFEKAARCPYEPHPMGLPSAREALARTLSSPGADVSPDDLILTASTSEAYSFLFKLLAEPGDEILIATPGYPLFEHLGALESVERRRFALELDHRWALHAGEAASVMSERTRAVAVVHPNNPTGSYLLQREQDDLAALCVERDIALISDEVFFDYPFKDDARRASAAAERRDALSFSLGGLSKSAGLPHLKLGWIRVGGPKGERARALAALELVADSFLSVATPVQRALPELLEIAPGIRSEIRQRTSRNLDTLSAAMKPLQHVRVLKPEGGWSVVIRIPAIRSDEETAMDILDRTGVVVHPGYFFDFPSDGFLVLSLLPEAGMFAEGARLLAEYLERMSS